MKPTLYKIVITDDEYTGMDAISIVKYPAVERNMLKFSKLEKQEFRAFDEERHIITGVVALADTPIYRYDEKMGGEYYVIFEKEVIRQMVEKYAKSEMLNRVNLQHDNSTFQDGIYMTESYIVDRKRGIVPVEFSDIPDGSWVVSFKVENEQLWKDIKESGELNGFSLQGMFQLEQAFSKKELTKINQYNQMKEMSRIALRNLILQFTDIESDKGTITVDGEVAVGSFVYVGDNPAEDGEYTIEGKVLVISEGKITDIRVIEEPTEPTEPVQVQEEGEPTEPVEPVTVETPDEPEGNSDRVAELEAMVAERDARIVELEARVAELEAKIAEQEEQMRMSVEKLAAEKAESEKPVVKKSIYSGLKR